MSPKTKINKECVASRLKKNRKSQRRSDVGALKYEKFEPRYLLAAIGELSPIQEQLILDYIADTPETAYLQIGSNDLEFVAGNSEGDTTTVLLQQTVNGIAVQNAFITAVTQDGQVLEVFDRGTENLLTEDGINPVVSLVDAEMIADHSLGNRSPMMSSELMWYTIDGDAELSWQVSTFLEESSGDFPTADFITYVDADSGVVLRQETPFELVEFLLDQPDVEVGEYGRIVINNTIGAAGSRAYAAPFDAVVELSVGCTGTLIAPNTVLTARHCGAGAGSQVRFGDNSNNPDATFTVQSSFLPDGGGSLLDGGDVSILTLTSNVPSNIATPMRLVSDTSALVGSVAATLGYGYNGLGSSGHGFSADGFRWGGENIIDRYGSPAGSSGSNIFSTDFDNGTGGANTISGSSATPLQFEATTAPGDSGGPLLVQVGGGEWAIAGVLSGGTTSTSVYGDISWWTGIADFQAAIEARGGVFVGSGAGSVGFDSGSYQIDDTFTVTVTDANPQPPISVTVTSDSGDSESLVLSGSGNTYSSSAISISDGAVSANDGTLQANVGDTITVTYVDPDDGSGSSSVETAMASILDLGSGGVLVGIDFDQTSGVNPANWTEVDGGSNQTFTDLVDEDGNQTAIDLTVTETPNGNWDDFAAPINASTLPQHTSNLTNLNGQIYNGSDSFLLTYSDLDPLADYEIYVFGLEGFFASIEQRVTIIGDGPSVSFNQIFNQNDLFINDQIGSSARALREYAQIITADSSGNIVIDIDPLGGTSDVVLGGVAIAAVVDEGEGQTIAIGDTNWGVLAADSATGTGYLMYSAESVHTRFALINPNNADHIVAVRMRGSQWQYTNKEFTGWRNFTPAEGDLLLADVDYSTDTVTSLEGTSSVIGGIDAGYASGDLVFTPNIWNGLPNDGEFGVTGSSFTVGTSSSTTTDVTPLNWGVLAADSATGTGYLMYSAESVHTRLALINPNNADHIVAVRLNGSQWQYTNKEFTGWRNFTPAVGDVLLADVNYSTDTVTSLEGTSSVIGGIDAGYTSGDLVFTPDVWNGGFNDGEFGVTGSFFDVGGASRQLVTNEGANRFDDSQKSTDLFDSAERLGTWIDYLSDQPEIAKAKLVEHFQMASPIRLATPNTNLQPVVNLENEIETEQRDRAFAGFDTGETDPQETRLDIDLLDIVQLEIEI